jgi:hypothetical protein
MLHISHHFYMAVSGLIFFLVGIGHAVRAYNEWEVLINGWMVPVWLSWLVVLVTFLLALAAVKHMR